MKKTLFMMMTVALVSGQAFGSTKTTVEGNLTGNVTVKEDASGKDWSWTSVYGLADDSKAEGAKVTMTGGYVREIHGGYVSNDGSASNNTVEVTGGIVRTVINGGISRGQQGEANGNTIIIKGGSFKGANVRGALQENYGEASKNTLIISGGTFSTGDYVWGGQSKYGDTKNNQVHLVGEKGVATIGGNTYEGQDGGLMLGLVAGGGWLTDPSSVTGTSEGNSIDLYGTKISVNQIIAGTVQKLNFHIVDSTDAILTIINYNYTLDLGGVELTFDFSEPVSPDSEITLIKSKGLITLDEDQDGSTWDIKDAKGNLTHTATLYLSDDKKTLKLGNINRAPEPATATLSLLALAGLCARRKRH